MDDFMVGPQSDELDRLVEDVDCDIFDPEEFNTCWKTGVEDRADEEFNDIPF